jgi:hypothetical protein
VPKRSTYPAAAVAAFDLCPPPCGWFVAWHPNAGPTDVDNAWSRRGGVMTSRDFDAERRQTQPPAQPLMVDKRNDQVGFVIGQTGPYVQLRPPQGGKERDVPPGNCAGPPRRRS